VATSIKTEAGMLLEKLFDDREIGNRGTEKPAPGCQPTTWCFSPLGLDSTWLEIAGVVGQPLRH